MCVNNFSKIAGANSHTVILFGSGWCLLNDSNERFIFTEKTTWVGFRTKETENW